MIYRNVLSAVVSVLAAECIDNTSKQAWQRLVGDDVRPAGGGMSADDRALLDCWAHARLHAQLSPRHWNVLVAKYSTHKGRKVQAAGRLTSLIATPAPKLFLSYAVYAWAIPKLKGVTGKRDESVLALPDLYYDMNHWDTEARPEPTRRRWRSDIFKALNQLEMDAIAAAEHVLTEEGVLPS
ncbi:MAG: hypothetical protein RBR45_11810 [Pseudomonas sp.]|nr:hypothetical protein [Pseudomonas sp.]